jgi:Tol biopolymer transport system component
MRPGEAYCSRSSRDAPWACGERRDVVRSRIGRFAGYALLVVASALAIAGGAGGATTSSGLIALDSADGLYTVNSDGSGAEKLPGSVAGNENPRWSPDGRKLVYWSLPPEIAQTAGAMYSKTVFTVDAGGSGRRQLANGEYPSWSWDGKQIAYDSPEGGDWHVWVMNADGSGRREIDTGRFLAVYPAFLPDGRLSFRAELRPNGNDGVWAGFYIVRLDGTGLTRLRTFSVDDTLGSWSPNGSTLAFTTHGDGKGEIATVSADGANLTTLTHNSVDDYDPVFTPDGRILFTSTRTGLPELFVMNADGTHVKRVTRFPVTMAEEGDWRPS